MLKILIAVDGSEHANRAIEAVGEMARLGFDVEATLLCVSPAPVFHSNYTLATVQKIEDGQKTQQNAILAKATGHARANGLKLSEPARGHGPISNEIVRIAHELQVDQIGIGTRGMGAIGIIGNTHLGSVAQRVLHQSAVPVLLVK